MHAQNSTGRLLQQFSRATEETEPYHEESCEKGDHQMAGYWNHIPDIRQFVGEPSFIELTSALIYCRID